MDNTLIVDLYMFFTASYGGLIAGLIYDLYRTIRYFLKPGKFISYILDLLFWIIIILFFFFILIKINWGEIRGFIVIGFFLGIIIYMKVFSKFILPICIKIVQYIYIFFSEIFSWVLFPLKFLKRKSTPTVRKMKNVPKEMIKEIKKHKRIISSKK